VALAAASLLVAGCQPDDEIRTYTVPRAAAAPSEQEFVYQEVEGPNKMRFLAAVIPSGDGYFWAVRFFAPAPVVDHYEGAFDAFVASLKIPASSQEKPGYTVPAGWRVGEPPSQMAAGFRLVTLHTGPKKKPVEMYLSTPVKDDRLDNVNRWREQFVGLPKITDAELKAQMQERKVGDTTAYIVDLRGPGVNNPGGGMRPPFAGGK
jgi:hypothetical protein